MSNTDIRVDLNKGEKLVATAFWLESLIALAKAVIGVLSGSLVLISDSIHSGSDLISIISSWLGLKIAQKEPDKRFTYGYYKAESLGTLVISTLILFAFYNMCRQAYSSFFTTSTINIPLFALGISFVDAIILFFFGNYEIKIGKQVGSRSLVAMGQENRTHVFSSSIVFIGTLVAFYKLPYIEGILTLVIAVLILKIGITALRDAVLNLMDVSPTAEIEEAVSKVIQEIPGVEDYFDLRLRRSGAYIMGDVKVGIRKSIDVQKAHDIVDRVELGVKKEIPQVESFFVHIEPFKSEFQHIVIPVDSKDDLNTKVSTEFSRAPYFLFVNIEGSETKGYYVLENPYKNQELKVGLSVSKFVCNQKIDVLITHNLGEISYYALKDYIVDIYVSQGESALEVIENFKKGKLERLQKPTLKE